MYNTGHINGPSLLLLVSGENNENIVDRTNLDETFTVMCTANLLSISTHF